MSTLSRRSWLQSLARSWSRRLPVLASSRRAYPRVEQLENRLVPAGTITTLGGGGLQFQYPFGVAVDTNGNVYVANSQVPPGSDVIQEVNTANPTPTVTVIAGGGSDTFDFSGGPATSFKLNQSYGVAVDGDGNVYFSQAFYIAEVEGGDLTSIAGIQNGGQGKPDSGDGGPATEASIGSFVEGVAVDNNGDVFFSETTGNRIREIDQGGTILTVAGTGTAGYTGDNGPANAAEINFPIGLATDGSGDLFFSDTGNHVVREIVKATGNIITVAGKGTSGYSGDGGPATAAQLSNPGGIAVDQSGNLFIADTGNHVIREVDATTHVITTIAGNGTSGYSGDNGPATAAQLNQPEGLALDNKGNLYIGDLGEHVIRQVALPITLTWTGNGDGSSWNDKKNWDGANIPITGDTLIFPSGVSGTLNNNIPGLTLSTIELDGSGYDLQGDAMTLIGGIKQTAGDNTYELATTLSSSDTFDVQAGSLTVTSMLDGTSTLTINGDGDLNLDGELGAGINLIDNSTGGGETDLGGQEDGSAAITVNGTLEGDDPDFQGAITLNAGGTLDVQVDGGLGTSTLTLDGGTLTNTIPVPASGVTPASAAVNTASPGGVLSLANKLVTVKGNITINAGAGIRYTGTTNVTGASTLTVNQPAHSVGVIFDNGSTLTGTSTLTLAGSASVTLEGTVDVPVIVNPETTLFLGTGSFSAQGSSGSITVNGTLTGESPDFLGAVTLNAGGTLKVTETNALGTGSLTLNGGTLMNTSSASVSLGNSTVTFGGDATLGTGPELDFTGTVNLTGLVDTVTVNQPADSNGLEFDPGSTLSGGLGNSVTLAGSASITLGGTVSAKLIVSPQTTLYLGDINNVLGNGLFSLQGEGLIFVQGTLNNNGPNGLFDGVVGLQAGGTIDVDATNGLGTGQLFLRGGTLTNTSSDSLSLGNTLLGLANSETINGGPGLTLPPNITGTTTGSDTATFNLTLQGNVTSPGTFKAAKGSAVNVTTGSTFQTASNSSLQLSDQGTLFAVNGSATIGGTLTAGSSSLVTVAAGGTFQASAGSNIQLTNLAQFAVIGTTTIAGMFMATNGILIGGTGSLTFAQSSVIAPSSSLTLQFQINGPTAGTDYFPLVINGAADIGHDTLGLNFGGSFTPQGSQSFTVIQGNNSMTGTLSAPAGGDTFTLNNTPFAISREGNSIFVRDTNPPPATQFGVTASGPVTVGSALNFTVVPEDADGTLTTSYSGTIRFSSSDTAAILPGPTMINFATPFAVTFKTVGTQTITVTDGSLTGTSEPITVTAAGGATHFFFANLPSSATAGSSFTFDVDALDSNNNLATGYSGSVQITSAALPHPVTVQVSDGTSTATVTLTTAGNQTLTATDTSNGLSGSRSITINGGPVSQFKVSAPGADVAGSTFTFTVAALDQFANIATGFVGTVTFLSSDPDANLPVPSTLTDGTGTFNATLDTAGTQSITAEDTSNLAIANSSPPILDSAAAASRLVVSAPTTIAAGSNFVFTVTALDQFSNTASGYGGSVTFTSTDSAATLPANSHLTNGSGTFSATLNRAGSQTLTATDTVTTSLSGKSAAIQVTFGAQTTISGGIFHDFNLNGVQDNGEPGLATQTVFLDLKNDGTLDAGDPSVTTNANGTYTLDIGGVAPGTYALRQVLNGGVLLSSPTSGSLSITVNGAGNFSNQNFADVLTSIAVPLTLPPTTPFPTQGNPNADYVEAVFRAVLDRDADAGGLAFWSAQLTNNTMTRVQVVDGIRNSVEHFGQEVDALYQTLLGRPPDTAGRAFWVSQLQAGTREEQIAFAFLDSPEYLSKGDKFFVDAMYQSLLGRAPVAGEDAGWLAALGDDATGNADPNLTATLTHAQVVTDFLFTQESLARLTEGYYEVFLQRQADSGGLNAWVGQLQMGLPFLSIGEQFIASDEFFNRAAANG